MASVDLQNINFYNVNGVQQKKAPDKTIVYAVSNPAKLATEIFTTYAGSMFPENENDEKNSESQTEGE